MALKEAANGKLSEGQAIALLVRMVSGLIGLVLLFAVTAAGVLFQHIRTPSHQGAAQEAIQAERRVSSLESSIQDLRGDITGLRIDFNALEAVLKDRERREAVRDGGGP